ITRSLLVLLVCMENIFKELFLQPSQGVSLSIADAKVDTFCKLTKHSKNFFSRFFNGFSQCADFQRESWEGNFREDRKIGIYMLQNMVFRGFWGIRSYEGDFAFVRNYFCMVGKMLKGRGGLNFCIPAMLYIPSNSKAATLITFS
ncbi:MAG: hypothetical protein IKY72_04760, partial [Bacteroidaceae bacterium]|nr:hypothetical protein [Bacteroidaceae bacterium]